MANSLPGSPIVGFYNEYSGDFEEHNRRIEISGGELKFEDTTRPYGFVDLNAKVWFQDYMDDGVVHTYLVTEGWLWTGQYPEAKRVISQGNNQSMELDNESLDGTWTIDDKSGMEFFIINEAVISKLCILGEEFEPCFEGSTISHFSLNLNQEFNQKIYDLMKEVKNLKGGNLFMENNPEVEVQEEQVFSADSADQVTEEPTVEENNEEILSEEDKTVSFSLEDFQNLQNSYNELTEKYSALEEQHNTLEANHNELTEQYNNAIKNYNTIKADFDAIHAECEELKVFKATKEKEEKQKMIDSFYMLSDEEKKDVQDNIDSYSLEEIEGKLSVICVHNKLDLSEKKDEDKQVETTFSFNETESVEDVDTPAWVSLLRKARKEN